MCLVAMSLTRLCSRLSLRSLLVQRRSWAKEGLGRPALRTEATAPAVVERSEPFEDTSEFVRTRPGLRAKIIDGRALAKKIHSEIACEVRDLVAQGSRPPNLTVVLVGDDPASHSYVSSKQKAAKSVGMAGEVLLKPDTISQEQLLDLIDQLNKDRSVDGLLIQLPLPSHINEKTVCNAVAPHKDVDGFHLTNIGRYCTGEPGFIPATPLGVLEMLKRCQVETFGKTACVVGRSKNIGFTLSALLHSDGHGTGKLTMGADATTVICHRYTPHEELKRLASGADIIITATGVPGLIKADMIKDGATVIDVGLSRITTPEGKTKLVGDVDFKSVAQVASLITPVPGGVGPMTVAMVLRNTLDAAKGVYVDMNLT